MLSMNDLKVGALFILDGQPHEVLEYNFMRMQQRKPVAQTKIKNLISGKIISRTFHQSETFKEAEIFKKELVFIYSHRNNYWFRDPKDSSRRFALNANILGEQVKFLKKDLVVDAYEFDSAVIAIQLPIKIDYEVTDAPPSVRGDTAQGGTKIVTLENGLEITTPLFIESGDIVRINTATGQYTERITKK